VVVPGNFEFSVPIPQKTSSYHFHIIEELPRLSSAWILQRRLDFILAPERGIGMASKMLLCLVTVVGLGIVSAQVNAQTTTVRMPTLAAGTTSIINTVISEKGFDKKNGLKIEYSVRTSIQEWVTP
jgi:septum formation topological specificity factor MinE